MITLNMIEEGLLQGLINIIDSPEDEGGVVCRIAPKGQADNTGWFYFGDKTEDTMSSAEYRKVKSLTETTWEIFDTLEGFRDAEETVDEYAYYEDVLNRGLTVKKFTEGQAYDSTCWFSGGLNRYIVDKKTSDAISFFVSYIEADGTGVRKESFPLRKDERGNEYVTLYSYKGEENNIYANTIPPMNDQPMLIRRMWYQQHTEKLIEKTAEISRKVKTAVMEPALKGGTVSPSRKYDELAKAYLKGSQEVREGIDHATAILTGMTLAELSAKMRTSPLEVAYE